MDAAVVLDGVEAEGQLLVAAGLVEESVTNGVTLEPADLEATAGIRMYLWVINLPDQIGHESIVRWTKQPTSSSIFPLFQARNAILRSHHRRACGIDAGKSTRY